MNEGAVCEAVVQILEGWAAASRGDVRRPENEPECLPEARIDYLVPVGSETWAIEHTVIESYENQIKHGRRFTAYIEPIRVAFSSGLSKSLGAIHLFVDDRELGRLPKKQLPASQAALIRWIRETLPLLANSPNHRAIERPSGVGFKVQLGRHRAPREGQLTIGRFAPPNLEQQRAKRIARALADKASKLEHWKKDGSRTILVLEDFDIALSNDVLVLDAMAAAFPVASAYPDRIVMVDSSTNAWCAYLLAEGGRVADESRRDIRLFDVAEVTQLRARPLQASKSMGS